MPEKEFNNIATQTWLVQALPFLMAVALSCVGGIVSYLNRIDKGGIAFSFFRMTIEIITSGFVGIVSFMLCDYAGLEWSATAAIVAISGHMGTRALFLIENAAVKIAENFIEGKTNGNRKRKTETTKQAD